MKTQRTYYSVTSLAILGLGLGLASVHAQAPAAWEQHRQSAPMPVRLATGESDAFSLSQLAGKPVRGANQEQLGTVSDFLIDPPSGALMFAIVPSGGGGAGETFRLLPMTAVNPSSGNDGLNVWVNQDQWNRVGTLTQAEIPARFTMNTEHLQRLASQFSVAGMPAPNVGATGELVRASALKGQAVRSGNDALGTVDDVMIDVRRRLAAAVVKASGGFMGNEQRYIVSFGQLKAADGGAGLATTLGRNEFAQATSGQTGYNSAQFNQAGGAHPAHAAVQQAVSQAAGPNVQVVPETKLVLRGTVDSDNKRIDAERAAVYAAPGMRVENQIEVRR